MLPLLNRWERSRLVSDAEVWQESLFPYKSINRRDAVQPAYVARLKLVEEVLPIDRTVVERAQQIVLAYRRLSSRDAVQPWQSWNSTPSTRF